MKVATPAPASDAELAAPAALRKHSSFGVFGRSAPSSGEADARDDESESASRRSRSRKSAPAGRVLPPRPGGSVSGGSVNSKNSKAKKIQLKRGFSFNRRTKSDLSGLLIGRARAAGAVAAGERMARDDEREEAVVLSSDPAELSEQERLSRALDCLDEDMGTWSFVDAIDEIIQEDDDGDEGEDGSEADSALTESDDGSRDGDSIRSLTSADVEVVYKPVEKRTYRESARAATPTLEMAEADCDSIRSLTSADVEVVYKPNHQNVEGKKTYRDSDRAATPVQTVEMAEADCRAAEEKWQRLMEEAGKDEEGVEVECNIVPEAKKQLEAERPETPSVDGSSVYGNSVFTTPDRVNEVDYDVHGPTNMYLAVEREEWDGAELYCATRPVEASTWVMRRKDVS